MAESFAFSIAKTVLGKLADEAGKEAGFLLGVEGNVTILKDQLEFLLAFLHDADQSTKDTERMKTLIGQVRDVAYAVEDAIDSYVLKIEQQRQRHGFFDSIRRCACSISHVKILHDLGVQVDGIRRRVAQIAENNKDFGFQISKAKEAPSSSTTVRAASGPNKVGAIEEEEEDPVGFDDDVKTLVTQLISGEARRAVVSIIGMGGLGKTTLAKKVYSDSRVKRHFDCQAWVYFSQEYELTRLPDLIRGIIESVMVLSKDQKEETQKLSTDELKSKLFDYLKQRAYLVVIDDIWRIDAWDDIRSAFPDERSGMEGSRVLLTTRIRDVAIYADKQSPHLELRLLGEKESWELFRKKAVGGTGCPPELEKIGRQIAAKCDGLPLALVVLGGLVSRKEQSPEEWREVLKSVKWELGEGKFQIKKILALSYNDLPYYLKPCFLYFSVFPEDSRIKVRDLIAMWVAEGFIGTRGDKTLEEVAKDYLEELINSSMIQVAERNFSGKVRKCQIHDLLLDLSISEAKAMKFLHVWASNDNEPPAGRRLVLHRGTGEYVFPSSPPPENLRSLICFNIPARRLGRTSSSFGASIKLLRVLDLVGTRIESIPNDIGQLIHLRYLRLREVRVLPSSIGRLQNLQTLDLKHSKVSILPSAIWQMHSLRHIFASRLKDSRLAENKNFFLRKPETKGLTNLQTLSHVRDGPWVKSELAKMTSLRNLRIYFSEGEKYGEALSKAIAELHDLNILKLVGSIPNTTCYLHPKNLQVLLLNGRLHSLPSSEEFQTSLTKITLALSRLQQDPLPILGKLPKLQILRLHKSFTGREMVCSERGFPQLKILKIGYIEEMESWKIEEEAMPVLRSLLIECCAKLNMLPEGLQRITTLKELELRRMPEEFNDRVRMGGADWYKIKHVPSLTIKN